MYDSSESTEYSGENSPLADDASRYCTRVRSSARIARSRMSGVASCESCERHVSTMRRRDMRGYVPRTR